MSTPNTVKAQLQNLIDISNRVTGKSDTDLTGAVNTLVDVYNDEKNSLISIIDGNVTEFYNDKITRVRPYTFAYCNKLISVSLPNATVFSNAVFYYNDELTNVHVPNIDVITNRFTYSCPLLEYLDLYNVSSLNGDNAFFNCGKLKTILLRKTQAICTLGGASSFRGTPIESGTGYIYVPRNLIETYKTATNWTTFASQFRVLEDYTVDGTTNGELDWDKVNGGTA